MTMFLPSDSIIKYIGSTLQSKLSDFYPIKIYRKTPICFKIAKKDQKKQQNEQKLGNVMQQTILNQKKVAQIQFLLLSITEMKNPFLHAQKYTVFKEYKRIANRSRSYSNSSFSSIGSDSSFDTKLHYEPSIRKAPRFQSEYMNPSLRFVQKDRKRHWRQQKTAKLFGIQQYRYTPAYLKEPEIHLPSKNHVQQQLRETNQEKKMEKRRFRVQQNSELHYISHKRIQGTKDQKIQSTQLTQKSVKEQFRDPKQFQDQKNETSTDKNQTFQNENQNYATSARRSSFLQTMVNIRNTVDKKNQFFDSIDQITSQKAIPANNIRKLKKKPSFFKMNLQKQSDCPIIRKSDSSTFNINQVSSASSALSCKKEKERSNFFLPITYKSNQHKNNVFQPTSILVRGRLYHLFQNPN